MNLPVNFPLFSSTMKPICSINAFERKVTVNGFCLEFLYQRPQVFGQMDDSAVSRDHLGLVFGGHCRVVVV